VHGGLGVLPRSGGGAHEVRAELGGSYQATFGPGGQVEAEDGENWIAMTEGATTAPTDDRPLHIGMGVGEECTDDRFPGSIGPLYSEHNRRGVYRNWRRWMDQP
jgi:hypothetical protein